jgi:hypothetical protein
MATIKNTKTKKTIKPEVKKRVVKKKEKTIDDISVVESIYIDDIGNSDLRKMYKSLMLMYIKLYVKTFFKK